MSDIVSDVIIKATPEQVFRGVATPAGLDTWWTKSSAGEPAIGAEYTLDFGPGYVWRGRVVACTPPTEFEIELTDAHDDWLGTRVGFRIEPHDGATTLRFHHVGWPAPNDHYRTSCYCWPIYLRLLRRNIEYGEFVPYERRLEA